MIAFLEDRRVLYVPDELEVPSHCVQSVIEIRRCLTEELFRLLHADPTLLPDDWRGRAGEAWTQRAATVVGDYVAGMTDRYAMDEHKRLTDISVNG